MFEYFAEDEEKKSVKISKEFKMTYFVMIFLMFFGVFFLYTISQPLFYYLYGYDPKVIDEFTVESFRAVEDTYQARLWAGYTVIGITFLCFNLSLAAIILKMRFKYYLNFFVFAISFFLLILFSIALMAPGRVF